MHDWNPEVDQVNVADKTTNLEHVNHILISDPQIKDSNIGNRNNSLLSPKTTITALLSEVRVDNGDNGCCSSET